MFTAIDSSAFDRVTDPVVRIFSPEQVQQLADYRADDALERRIAELAQKSNEGELTEAEQAEYAGYVQANKFVALLQVQARKVLAAGHV